MVEISILEIINLMTTFCLGGHYWEPAALPLSRNERQEHYTGCPK